MIIRKILAALCAVLLTLSLCACGDDSDTNDGSDSISASLSEEDKWIAERLYRSEQCYAWFTGSNRPDTAEGSETLINGDEYLLVTENGISSIVDLRTLLGNYFTDSIINRLLSTCAHGKSPLFVEQDGALYIYSSFVGDAPWDIGERVGSVTERTDTLIVYHVDMSYQYYNTTVTAQFDYHLVLGEDGVWRFDRYQLPAALLARELFSPPEE